MPCGKCHKRPPYQDGSWTQKHRIKPESKGGRYTKRNTVPRCPSCHAKEPGHDGNLIMLPLEKRREAGRIGGPIGGLITAETHRRNGWQHQRNISPLRLLAARAKYTPDQLRTFSRDGALKGNHLRWHVHRGIVKPACPYCR